MYNRHLYRLTDNIDLLGIPKSEFAASAFIRRMKTLHDGQTNDDEPAEFADGKYTDFRRVIWKILLQNSQRVVMAIRSRNLGLNCRSNMVSCVFYNFSISHCRR
jgi:hypothetical protein